MIGSNGPWDRLIESGYISPDGYLPWSTAHISLAKNIYRNDLVNAHEIIDNESSIDLTIVYDLVKIVDNFISVESKQDLIIKLISKYNPLYNNDAKTVNNDHYKRFMRLIGYVSNYFDPLNDV